MHAASPGHRKRNTRQGRSVKGRAGKGGTGKGLSGNGGGTYFEPTKVRSKYCSPLASSLSTVARRKKAEQARTVDEHSGSKYREGGDGGGGGGILSAIGKGEMGKGGIIRAICGSISLVAVCATPSLSHSLCFSIFLVAGFWRHVERDNSSRGMAAVGGRLGLRFRVGWCMRWDWRRTSAPVSRV